MIEKSLPPSPSGPVEKNQKKVIVRKSENTNSAIVTPAVMRIVSLEGISLSELELIEGTGANGRVT